MVLSNTDGESGGEEARSAKNEGREGGRASAAHRTEGLQARQHRPPTLAAWPTLCSLLGSMEIGGARLAALERPPPSGTRLAPRPPLPVRPRRAAGRPCQHRSARAAAAQGDRAGPSVGRAGASSVGRRRVQASADHREFRGESLRRETVATSVQGSNGGTAASARSLNPNRSPHPVSVCLQADPELLEVLDLATDEELEEVHAVSSTCEAGGGEQRATPSRLPVRCCPNRVARLLLLLLLPTRPTNAPATCACQHSKLCPLEPCAGAVRPLALLTAGQEHRGGAGGAQRGWRRPRRSHHGDRQAAALLGC